MVGIPFHNFNLVSVVNGHIPANYCEVRDLAVQRDAKVDCFLEFWYPRILIAWVIVPSSPILSIADIDSPTHL